MSTSQDQGRHRSTAERPASGRHAHPASRKRRRRAIVAAGTVALVGGGVALAAWTVSGNGPADAAAIGNDDIVIDDEATPTAQLFPGGYGDVTFRVQNPLPYPVTLNTVTYNAITPSGTCPAGSVEAVAASATLATPIVLPKESGFTTVVLDDAVRMLPSATDACKNATFSIDVGLSGVSSGS